MALQNIAVLIDADNASAKTIGTVFAEIEKLGKIRCKKIYGDWAQDNLKSWQEVTLRYAIDVMQQFAYVKGKNATDIALVIEAMDLLHSGEYDGFCLVSSDSDFASLAVRIRKSGLPVYGFGKESAVISFKQACDKFFAVEKLGQITPTPNKSINTQAWKTQQLQKQTQFIQAVKTVLQNNPKAENGWLNVSHIVNHLNQNHPTINYKRFGYGKFSDLISAFRLFDIKKQQNGTFVKLKTVKNTAKPLASSQTATIESQKTTPLLFSGKIQLTIETPYPADTVLWRLTAENKVRGDMDMIFYGQNFSEDGLIELQIEQNQSHTIANFSCDLAQPTTIEKFYLTVTSENPTLSHETPIKVSISQSDKMLFTGDFLLNQTDNQSVLLFEIKREQSSWRFYPKKQQLNGDLRLLCETYGIEVSND